MSHGYPRRRYQILPVSKEKITCVEINDAGFAEEEWWERSVTPWTEHVFCYADWDYVLVVPLVSVRLFWCSNDGMQAWRYRPTGYVVPDHCRQTGGCPEMWNLSDVRGKRELVIKNLDEIEPYVVLRHDHYRGPFPEHVMPRMSRIS